ncbi:Sodium-dependent multivitamin transporter [Bulinus truncatus]|nr:Sodium-dependent multivitamin transporter [Bulinus truncatus]
MLDYVVFVAMLSVSLDIGVWFAVKGGGQKTQVTGIPVWVTFLTTGAIATIYTTIGGIKAVIWSDVFQSLVMLAGILTIVIQGTLKVGGLSKVWDINDKWQRIRFFNFDPDPRVRHTFWNMIIGQTFLWLAACGVNQLGTQRYCSLSSLREAQLPKIHANSYGAISGALVGLGLSFWVGFGAYIKGIRLPPKPFPNGTCSTTAKYSNSLMSTLAGSLTASNLTMTSAPYTLEGSTTLANFTLDLNTSGVKHSGSALGEFYAISYMYLPVVGDLSCVVVGLLVSAVTGLNKMSDIPIKYQIPVAYRLCCCLPQSWQRWLNCNTEQPTNGDVATTSIKKRSTELKPLLAPQVWPETGRLNVTENSSIDQTDSETQ